MALIRCDFFSEALQLSTSMTVILPQATSGQVGMSGRARSGAPPTLYLLHGMSDDDTTWLRRTSIERYVAPLGLAVVMPQVNRSFYADEAYGNRYWTFLSEELPEVAGSFFRLSERREDTFVAGLSMGGYGAIKWALRQPERFAAAASLSGTLDMAHRERADGRPGDRQVLDRIFGARAMAGTGDDLLWLVGQADPNTTPALYLCCGTEDELFPDSERFLAACHGNGIAATVDFGPGAHEWDYWDRTIRDVLAWLPLSPSEA